MLRIAEADKEEVTKLINMLSCETPMVKSLTDQCLWERLTQLIGLFEVNFQADVDPSETSPKEMAARVKSWLSQYYKDQHLIDKLSVDEECDRTKLAVLVLAILYKVRHSLPNDATSFLDPSACLVRWEQQLNTIINFEKLLTVLQNELATWKRTACRFNVQITEMKKKIEKLEEKLRSDNRDESPAKSNKQNDKQKTNNMIREDVKKEKINETEIKEEKADVERIKQEFKFTRDLIDEDEDSFDESQSSTSQTSGRLKIESNCLEPQVDILTTNGVHSEEELVEADEVEAEAEVGDDFEDPPAEPPSVVTSQVNVSKTCAVCGSTFQSNYEFNVHLLRDHAAIDLDASGAPRQVIEEIETPPHEEIANDDENSSDEEEYDGINSRSSFEPEIVLNTSNFNDSQDSRQKHMYLNSSGSVKVLCSVPGCGKFFRKGYELKRHELTHRPVEERQLYVCDYPNCNKRYTTTNKLKMHKRSKHHWKGDGSSKRTLSDDEDECENQKPSKISSSHRSKQVLQSNQDNDDDDDDNDFDDSIFACEEESSSNDSYDEMEKVKHNLALSCNDELSLQDELIDDIKEENDDDFLERQPECSIFYDHQYTNVNFD